MTIADTGLHRGCCSKPRRVKSVLGLGGESRLTKSPPWNFTTMGCFQEGVFFGVRT